MDTERKSNTIQNGVVNDCLDQAVIKVNLELDPANVNDESRDQVQYEDPTMILTKSRVTIGLLGLVIVTLSIMMIFVILSVKTESSTSNPHALYVISKINNITH